jgi:hypothetical protein
MDQVDYRESTQVAKIFVVCERIDTAPVWGYILRHQGVSVIPELCIEKAIGRGSIEMPDKARGCFR